VDSIKPLSTNQLELALMMGADPVVALDWIDADVRNELLKAAAINPNLLPDLGPTELTWDDRINYWHIPLEYYSLDIKTHVLSLCRDDTDRNRVEWELEEFESKSLLPVLKAGKYIVDVMRKNNVVWGLGRGSSVSSLTLFLLGIHKVDPIKWNLDPTEFFK